MPLTFDRLTSQCVGVIYWPCPVFLRSTMTVTHKLFKILSTRGFWIKRYYDLDLWPKNVSGSSTEYGQSYNRLEWLSLINLSRYWADTVFALNATVTLTFDLVTSKCMEVICWPRPIFLSSTMTITHTLFKILSGHGFLH